MPVTRSKIIKQNVQTSNKRVPKIQNKIRVPKKQLNVFLNSLNFHLVRRNTFVVISIEIDQVIYKEEVLFVL